MESRLKKQRLFNQLNQAEKSSRLLNYPANKGDKANINTKLNLNLNRFIKANEFRNKKLQIQKKLDNFGSEETEEIKKRNIRITKANEEIHDLKMRRLFYQIKLKLFYIDLLDSLPKPRIYELTAPEIVRKLWNIKGTIYILLYNSYLSIILLS